MNSTVRNNEHILPAKKHISASPEYSAAAGSRKVLLAGSRSGPWRLALTGPPLCSERSVRRELAPRQGFRSNGFLWILEKVSPALTGDADGSENLEGQAGFHSKDDGSGDAGHFDEHPVLLAEEPRVRQQLSEFLLLGRMF
ncbi:hypothetical protein Z043_111454 [Scleropages formosus]|uniref:Uncharacterized protein n=1 Tax=Scleropages formosus TaxID=113540 RepID=A0A0P7U6C8_SCLFO|nr:hypothetical protein Z043_111454 [Scleropages formosus]